MDFPEQSQAYYENSFQKLNFKATETKPSDPLSDISFSEEVQPKNKKIKSKFDQSEKKALFSSPFASLFEIGPSNKSKKTKHVSEDLFFSQQPANLFSTQTENSGINSNIFPKDVSCHSERKSTIDDHYKRKTDFFLSQSPDIKQNLIKPFNFFENAHSNLEKKIGFKKFFDKKEIYKTKNVEQERIFNSENKNFTNSPLRQEIETRFERIQINDYYNKNLRMEVEKNTEYKINPDENKSLNNSFITTPAKKETSNVFFNKFKNSSKLHIEDINRKTEKNNLITNLTHENIEFNKNYESPISENVNSKFTNNFSSPKNKPPETFKPISYANPLNKISDDNDLKLNTHKKNTVYNYENLNPKSHNKPETIFNLPKYNSINTDFTENTTNKKDGKTYSDIFKQRIDQKKVFNISNQAKQNTLISISQQAVPNKKHVAKYMENFIKKNKLDQTSKINPEKKELQELNKLLFEEEIPKKDYESKKFKKKPRKNYLFAQEEAKNSEESVSDLDSDSLEGENLQKLPDLDLDFERFFEENPIRNKKTFRRKGKIEKKLDVKADRIRIKKEKQIKEYLLETHFTYSAKPLKWQKLPITKDKDKLSEFKLPELEPFIAESGVKIPHLLTTITPYDFFVYFMPESIYAEISRLTNITASLDIYSQTSNTKKRTSWKESTPEDIKKWFGLLFLFGIVRKYNVNEYWTNDPLLGIYSVSKIMGHHRFNSIRKYISLYDRRKKADFEKIYPPLDPFYKFRFLLEHINDVCRKAYVPERELSVDESMISYQGIHRLKVYIPRKPTKWGFKAFVLSESSTGYLCHMILNEGHKRGEDEDILSKRIVLEILHGFEHKGFRVYMDRWYTSADLLSELKKRGIGGCGTIFLSRVGLVNDLRKEVRQFKEPGDATFYTNNDLMFVAFYHYRRQVYVLSNFHPPEWVKVEKVRKIAYFCKKEYKIYDYDAPLMIRQYNMYMGGVDHFNQKVSYYNVDYDIMKWYMRLVFWIFEIAMVNSYIIYSKVMSLKKLKPIASSEYRLEVIRNMTHWNHDPTKPIFRKGVTDKITEEDDLVDREFHNLNMKRKNQYDSNKLEVFTELKIDIKCILEYIGVGTCHICRRRRHKLKKTDFWCKSCYKGVCVNCFDSHRTEIIFKKLNAHKNTNDLLNHLITKKKMKVEKASEYYDNHVKKEKNPSKTKEVEISLTKSTLESEIQGMRKIDESNSNALIINEESSNISSSEESMIMEVRKPNKNIQEEAKINLDIYLKKKKEKNRITEEIKNDSQQYQSLKAVLDNFYSLGDEKLERDVEKERDQYSLEIRKSQEM